MRTLFVKPGATGDVVRTTPLLRRMSGLVTWVTSAKNRVFLDGLAAGNVELEVLSWDDRERNGGTGGRGDGGTVEPSDRHTESNQHGH